jgi:hypothetical protein
VVMDLGQAIDNKTLLGENSYQLIVRPGSTPTSLPSESEQS